MSDITWRRPDFNNALKEWQLVLDALEGERKVKEAKTLYLPKPNPSDKSPQNEERYKQYVARSVFYPVTGRTQKGLVSLVYQKDPVQELPAPLEYLETDVDGSGNGIVKQSQKVLGRTLGLGRHALLVDYPNTQSVQSRKDKEDLGIRATIISVRAEQVVNWRTEKIGGRFVYTLVVIKEEAEEVDGFAVEAIEQYRELSLINGVYVVQIWRKVKDKDEWFVHDSYIPTDGSGSEWNVIPFQFIGSENNDADIDYSPLADLARLNMAHYRNSADYEDSCYLVGQAQPVITGLDEAWRDWLEEKGIYFGSRSALPLPVNGDAKFIQAQPNSLPKEAMDAKEKQMVSIGAHLIEKGSAVKTATQQRSEDAVSHSVVSLCAANVSEAYQQAIRWVAQYENVSLESDVEFELNREYMNYELNPQAVQALVNAWQQGAFAKFDLRQYFRKLNLIDPERTDEEIDEELDSEDTGPDLDPFMRNSIVPNQSDLDNASA